MRNTMRLDNEQAIARELLNLKRQGVDPGNLEQELARRYAVDLDMLDALMVKIRGYGRAA